MRTFSLLKGLPVYELKSGNKIGEVCDLSITANGRVLGLLLRKGALFRKSYIIKVENVASFGWDGIIVDSVDVLEPVKNPPDYTIEHQQNLSGKMLITTEGEKLGLLQDVYFMEEVGTIIGYELTDGFFSDITEGRRVVKTAEPPAIGNDAIIVNVKT
ncbi:MULTISPECIES: PRC-barrel domain-containing protein [Bacillus]|uniref:PRC-barrel domain-containing protein n=1 Tax=Bacillus TaxID=1386 RepID=UPI000C7631AF|nr:MULTISPECIES: PRC-barrel domain-containing protein [Bacillus]PLR81879.1 photosystem reaction center subunit H [Bacillus sp. V33-4]RSK47261.1 photosystem reaction center subunit H [Bacillus canaveralius]